VLEPVCLSLEASMIGSPGQKKFRAQSTWKHKILKHILLASRTHWVVLIKQWKIKVKHMEAYKLKHLWIATATQESANETVEKTGTATHEVITLKRA
jgi:hypothetical protein